MYSPQIKHICENNAHLKHLFRGVYCLDELPIILQANSIYILNTACTHSGGRHWVLLFCSPTGRCTYFDSLGVGLERRAAILRHIITFNDRNCMASNLVLQSDDSQYCGWFAIYVALKLSQGLDFHRVIQDLYDLDTRHNDYLIVRLCHVENLTTEQVWV